MSECPTCGKEYKSRRGVEQHHSKTHNERIGGTKVDCENCGDTVRRKPSRIENCKNIFCSTECKSDYERVDRLKKICEKCGDGFTTPPWEDAIHCSNDCAKGTKIIDCEYCGDEYEVFRSAESSFCSKGCQHEWQKENWTGENGPNWKGGWEKYYGAGWQEFRREIREYYNHTCQECGEECQHKHHDVHHIKPIREFDAVENAHFKQNVVLLCESCHKRIEVLTTDEQRQLFDQKT